MARFPLGASLLDPADPASNFCRFSYLSCEIFKDGSRVDCSCGSHTTMASRSVLEMTVNTTDWELYGKLSAISWRETDALLVRAVNFNIPGVQHGLNVRRLLPLLFRNPYQLFLLPMSEIIENIFNF